MAYLSCVTTIYNEGKALKVSIASLLSQIFQDFEIIVVDDGACTETRKILKEFNDPRIKYIQQSNDGLSSARNRGIAHCKGEYICFLDADDMRPAWAFEEIVKTIKYNQQPDCIFTCGRLIELQNQVLPFYDSSFFKLLNNLDYIKYFDKSLPYLMSLEPQSANKVVKKEFLKKHQLFFPNGLCFEDSLFHMGVVANLKSFAIVSMPCFSYYRRYGRPQITSGTGITRIDAISVVFMTLELFSKYQRFENKALRLSLLLSVFKLLKWCEESITHIHKYHFHQAVIAKVKNMDSLYFDMDDKLPLEYEGYSDVMDYFKRCKV